MLKRTTLPKLLLVSVLSFTAAACNESDQPAGQSGDSSESTHGDEVAPTVSNEFEDDLFQVCSLEEENSPDEGYEVATFTIDGEIDSARTFSYTGSTCAKSSPDGVETEIESSFVYPGGSTMTPQGVVTHRDTTVKRLLFDGQELTSAQADRFMNLGVYQTRFDIALIDNDILFSGDNPGENDSFSAQLRPTPRDLQGYDRQ